LLIVYRKLIIENLCQPFTVGFFIEQNWTIHKSAMPENKIKVIYIASNAHAGSSITDIVLGQSENLVSFGQVCDVLFRSEAHANEIVTNFWRKVFEDKDYDNSKKSKDNAVQLYHEKALLKAMFNTNWSNKHLEIYENLYSLMFKYSNEYGKVIVDSSKNTSHAIALSRSDKYDVHYIHLIKTPESFIDSINKRRLEFNKKPIVFISYLRWSIKAFLNNVILKYYVKNYIKIKYVDISNFSESGSIDNIEKFIGEDLSETRNVLNGKQMEKYHYALSGNRIVDKQNQIFKPYGNKQAKYGKLQLFLINLLTKNPITRWLYN